MKDAGTYILDAATSSGILKAKQKIGRTFNSDKLGGTHCFFFGNFRSEIQTWESTSFGAKLG